MSTKAATDYASRLFICHSVCQWGRGLQSNSRCVRFEAEPLISSDAVRRFDNRKSLLLVRGHNGAVLDKLHFFLDRDYIEASKRVAHHGEALNVPVLEPLKEGPLFEQAPEAVAAEPEPESVKPAIAAPEPAVAIAAPAAAPTPEPYLVQALEPAVFVAPASAGEDEEESFSLDLPAFGGLKKLLDQADAVAKTHPVVARLRKVIEEDASAGLVEPGTDLSAFIRASNASRSLPR